jgi:hypothetical protein
LAEVTVSGVKSRSGAPTWVTRLAGLRLLPPRCAAKRDGKRVTLATERKLLRRCYHTLRELGDAAVAMPITEHLAA